jgi:CHAT domain-containing protein
MSQPITNEELIHNDNPIDDPDDDLLGMKQSAEVLANYLKRVDPPFILGVYGQWGEGKTSFVDMIHYHLTPPAGSGRPIDANASFITLQAWPYTTSDELWRALVLRITDELCKPAKPNTQDVFQPVDGGLLAMISKFLESPALPLYMPPEEKKDQDPCEKMRRTLDSGFSHSISRQADNQAQINQEAALSALVRGVLTALSSISPLVAGIRSLFNIPTDLPVSELFRKGKSETISQNVQSIQDLQRDFKSLFWEIARNKRIYIFIDDLDRCLPNVALDLLEAIRNFLPAVNCVFIIAADENLIGQGLRLRYKDLFESGDPKRAETYLSQKGQEFFEKIIQFGVRVPPRTQAETHAFIAAQFPDWMPATDIILTAIGKNPRRLKQYCNLLSYKYNVSRERDALDSAIVVEGTSPIAILDQATLSLFQNLIQVCSRNPICRDLLVEIACEPSTCSANIAGLEKWLNISENDRPAKGSEEYFKDRPEREQDLFNCVVKLGPLLKLFKNVHFSAQDPDLIVTLGGLADIHPNPVTTLHTEDRVFMRLLHKAVLNLPLTPNEILQGDFTKLLELRDCSTAALSHLYDLANEKNWKDLLLLEDFLVEVSALQQPNKAGEGNKDNQATALPAVTPAFQTSSNLPASLKQVQIMEHLTSLVGNLPEAIRPLGNVFLQPSDATGSQPNQPLVDLFLREQRFSTMLPSVVRIFIEDAEHFKPENVEKSNYQSDPKKVDNSQVAKAAIQNMPFCSLSEVYRSLNIRIAIAQTYLTLREFAKLDLLADKWPALGEELRENPEMIKRFETLFIEKTAIPEDLRQLYQEYSKDKNLRDFLNLRPLFRDIKKLKTKVAQVSIMPEKVEAPDAMLGKTPEAVKAVEGVTKGIISKQEPYIAPGSYHTLTLKIKALSPPMYELELTDGDGKTPMIGQVEILKEDIEKRILPELSRLAQMPYSQVTRSITPVQDARKMASDPAWDDTYPLKLQEIATILYNWFIAKSGLEPPLLQSLSHEHLRLLLEIDPSAAPLNDLPWEGFYIPSREIYLGCDSRYSVVRWIPTHSPRNELLNPKRPPLRVLAILSSPIDMPPINIQGEKQILIETLGEEQANHNIELVFLEKVTREKLQMALLRNRPDIVHFVGHGVYDPAQQKGILLVEDEQGRGRPLDSESVKILLADQNVRAVVLNGCHTGSARGSQDVTTSIAGMLVEAGIPLVVATLRNVRDDAALLFSRTFYASLAVGTQLEVALAQARKALKLEGFDWTIYALYANTSSLDQVLFLPQRTAQEMEK